VNQTDKLIGITQKTERPLLVVTGIWPFDLFPNTVKLDRKQVLIIERFFFKTIQVVSMPIEDILNVEMHAGPVFGSIDIVSRFFTDNHRKVNWLWKRDAIKMRRLIQGMVIAHKDKIDITKIDRRELIRLLYSLAS